MAVEWASGRSWVPVIPVIWVRLPAARVLEPGLCLPDLPDLPELRLGPGMKARLRPAMTAATKTGAGAGPARQANGFEQKSVASESECAGHVPGNSRVQPGDPKLAGKLPNLVKSACRNLFHTWLFGPWPGTPLPNPKALVCPLHLARTLCSVSGIRELPGRAARRARETKSCKSRVELKVDFIKYNQFRSAYSINYLINTKHPKHRICKETNHP